MKISLPCLNHLNHNNLQEKASADYAFVWDDPRVDNGAYLPYGITAKVLWRRSLRLRRLFNLNQYTYLVTKTLHVDCFAA